MMYLYALLLGIALAAAVRTGLPGLVLLLAVLAFVLRQTLHRRDQDLKPRNSVERWIFGTYANWALYNYEYDPGHSLLEPNYETAPILLGGRRGPYHSGEQRQYFLDMLDSPWGIYSKEDLLETVEYMSVGPGFRKCRTKADQAWELCRCTQLLAIAFRLGWISRREMVQRSCQVGRLIQTTFSGWQEMSESFLERCLQWMEDPSVGADRRRAVHKALWTRPDSPYCLPWDLPLK
ncbi:DUF1266 domain-containing protein [Pseudoflavonifractor sp. 60]|uniref:DUF1266 domain-containing protein n=1 Tax=Pseudoflavonifractor sp. 60 TaxID=2304576 RepID=UPI001370F293|nr:DUF1266 domain-containing protein [Pseudoflavonifractor sp. 60]NBI67414.1 DUF1266 domain-containing protein [Pseudoflavonifractor sp. 60]